MLVDKELFVLGKVSETRLKPSEAILIGAAKREQCRDYFFTVGRTCVLGAMYEGYYGVDNVLRFNLGDVIYDLLERCSGMSEGELWRLAVRNNSGEMRESIAESLKAQGL